MSELLNETVKAVDTLSDEIYRKYGEDVSDALSLCVLYHPYAGVGVMIGETLIWAEQEDDREWSEQESDDGDTAPTPVETHLRKLITNHCQALNVVDLTNESA